MNKYGDRLQTQYVLPVESLEVGQSITVVFRNPDDGRVGLTLVTGSGDFVLRAAIRVNWRSTINTFILNTWKNDKWGPTVRPDSFPFPPEGVSTRISMTVSVQETKFVVSANGIEIADFPYRGSLTYDKVDKILWGANEDTATKKSKLEKITISFP